MLANLTLLDVVGETQASSFMLDMNALFERFVTERLQRALQGTPRREEPAPRPARRRGHRGHPARPGVPSRTALARFVADIKYKLTDETAAGRHPDYYQLLAYTTALDLPEGVLIYCLDANRDVLTGKSETDTSATGDPGAGNLQTDDGGPVVRSVRVRHTRQGAATPTRWTCPARPRMLPGTWTGSPIGSRIGPQRRSQPTHRQAASSSVRPYPGRAWSAALLRGRD